MRRGSYTNLVLTGVAVSTLKDIQLAIATEELIWTEDRVAVEQETTPGTFITEGLAIEKQQ